MATHGARRLRPQQEHMDGGVAGARVTAKATCSFKTQAHERPHSSSRTKHNGSAKSAARHTLLQRPMSRRPIRARGEGDDVLQNYNNGRPDGTDVLLCLYRFVAVGVAVVVGNRDAPQPWYHVPATRPTPKPPEFESLQEVAPPREPRRLVL